MMGISKKALLEDFYPDEIGEVMEQWNELHHAEHAQEEEVDPMAFFGDGGEKVE